jgi:hypothetical protein
VTWNAGDLLVSKDDNFHEFKYAVVLPPWHNPRTDDDVLVVEVLNKDALRYPFVAKAADFKLAPKKPKYAVGDSVQANGDTFTVHTVLARGETVYYVLETRSGGLTFYSEYTLEGAEVGVKVGDYISIAGWYDDNRRVGLPVSMLITFGTFANSMVGRSTTTRFSRAK